MFFFSAFIGRGIGVADWVTRVHSHAAWAGLSASWSPCIELMTASPPQRVDLDSASAAPTVVDRAAHVLVVVVIAPAHCSPGVAVREEGATLRITPISPVQSLSATNRRNNAIRLTARPDTGTLTVAVPPASPDHCFHTRVESGFVVGDDLRMMLRFSECGVNERAVYSLLRYGAIPAPLSLVNDISRVPGGHRMTLFANDDPPAIERDHQVASIAESSLDPGEADRRFLDALDTVVGASPPRSVVYFSGGVDSSLLAWRCMEQGCEDVRLINYRFREDDPDGIGSRRIADHLGLPFEQVRYDPSQIPEMLTDLSRDYSFPFVDASAIPTNLLVRASIERLGAIPLVLEGTGADGGFGMGTSLDAWSKASRIPRWMRGVVSATYGPLSLWRSVSDGSGAMRALRRTFQEPLPMTVLTTNLLDGMAYRTPLVVRRAIREVFDGYMRSLCDGISLEGELCLLDLIHIGAGRFAAKSFDPLRMRGVVGVYPFLEPDMVSLAVALPWSVKSEGQGPKGMLKRLLAQRVPPEEVYRKKTGFSPPFARMLGGSVMQAFMRDVVHSPSNPFLAYADQRMLGRITDHAQAGGNLSSSAVDFAWMMMFLAGWWSGLERGSQ